MDKASAPGAGDSRLESWADHYCGRWLVALWQTHCQRSRRGKEPPRNRAWNLQLPRPIPYPLGHATQTMNIGGKRSMSDTYRRMGKRQTLAPAGHEAHRCPPWPAAAQDPGAKASTLPLQMCQRWQSEPAAARLIPCLGQCVPCQFLKLVICLRSQKFTWVRWPNG